MNSDDWALTKTVEEPGRDPGPIRHRLFGELPGAPSTARRGGLTAGPLEGKRNAQASGMEARRGETRHGWLDAPHDSATRHRRGTHGNPANLQCVFTQNLRSTKTTFTHLRKTTEPYICRSGFAPIHKSGLTYLRQVVHPQTRQSVKPVKRKKARNIRRANH